MMPEDSDPTAHAGYFKNHGGKMKILSGGKNYV